MSMQRYLPNYNERPKDPVILCTFSEFSSADSRWSLPNGIDDILAKAEEKETAAKGAKKSSSMYRFIRLFRLYLYSLSVHLNYEVGPIIRFTSSLRQVHGEVST